MKKNRRIASLLCSDWPSSSEELELAELEFKAENDVDDDVDDVGEEEEEDVVEEEVEVEAKAASRWSALHQCGG